MLSVLFAPTNERSLSFRQSKKQSEGLPLNYSTLYIQNSSNSVFNLSVRGFGVLGGGLLGNESWSCQYELSLISVQFSHRISLSKNGDFAQMENWAEVVFNNGKTLLKIRIYEILIQSGVAQNQLFEAIRIGIETLQLLEIEIPTHASPADVGLALQSLQSILSQQRVERFTRISINDR